MGRRSSPNDIVGHLPFIYKEATFPWSKIDSGKVRLLLFVTPESRYLEERSSITVSPPAQGPIQTFFLLRNLRTTQRLHSFHAFMEEKVETLVRTYGGFFIPPNKEICLSKKEGRNPEWILVKQTSHILCEKGKIRLHCIIIENQITNSLFLRLQLLPLTNHPAITGGKFAGAGGWCSSKERRYGHRHPGDIL